jgi:uncharacterized protein (TIGR02246 family)
MHRKNRRQCIQGLVVALFGWAICGSAPASTVVTHLSEAKPVEDLDAVYQRLSAAYRALDSSAAITAYTQDALYLQPDEELVQGRKGIQAAFERLFEWAEAKNLELRLTFEIMERDVEHDLAYDVGLYTLARFHQGDELGSSRGKFVLISRRQADGSWLFHVDGFSRSPK